MPQLVKISVTLGFQDLEGRKHLTPHIAEILSLWAQVEDELATIFAYGMTAPPAIAAAALGCTANLATRLAMVQTTLSLGVSAEAAKAFEKAIVPRVRKVAKRRNRIAHAIWTTHADYPDDLIRLTGLTSPTLDTERWTTRDFLEVKLAMAELQLQLREYAQTLPEARSKAEEEGVIPYWQFAAPDLSTEGDQGSPNEARRD